MTESVNGQLNRIKSNIATTYNTLNEVGLINDENNGSDGLASVIKNLSWGGGELCDIGLALFIDESAGMRRLLNGQILNMEPKYKPFLNKLQLIATVYPNILVTEEEWQSIKSVSVYGQVGKFVLNYDESGEIIGVRLPAIVNLQGLQDLQYLGNIVEAGIPQHSHTSTTDSVGAHTHARGTMNITGQFAYDVWQSASYDSGAFSNGGGNKRAGTGTDNNSSGSITKFDASKSWTGATSSNGAHTHTVTVSNANESHYGKANTVQQEAIQYPYYIQVNLTEYNHMIDVGHINDITVRLEDIEGYNTNTRLNTLEGYNTNTRLNTLEGYNTNTRLNTLEGYNTNTRLKTLEKAYIIETYRNGNNWYRVWSNGFCEQGGLIHKGSGEVANNLITFFKPYLEVPNVIFTRRFNSDTSGNSTAIQIRTHSIWNVTLTGFYCYANAWSNSSEYWEAKGYIAL